MNNSVQAKMATSLCVYLLFVSLFLPSSSHKCHRNVEPVWLSEAGSSPVVSSPLLADVNGDNVLDVAVCAFEGQVSVIDGRTGHELPGWPVTASGHNLHAAPLLVRHVCLKMMKCISNSPPPPTAEACLIGPPPQQDKWDKLPYLKFLNFQYDIDKDGLMEVLLSTSDGIIMFVKPDGTPLMEPILKVCFTVLILMKDDIVLIYLCLTYEVLFSVSAIVVTCK